MENEYFKWIEFNKGEIEKLGIEIDEVVSGEGEYSQSSTRVDFISSSKMSRITVFRSGRVYVQILEIETAETHYIFDDYLESKDNLSLFLWDAIKKMQ